MGIKTIVGAVTLIALGIAAVSLYSKNARATLNTTSPTGGSAYGASQSPDETESTSDSIIKSLKKSVSAAELGLSALNPDVMFDSVLGENLYLSREFERKLQTAVMDKTAIAERQKVLAGTINVTPSTKDEMGYTELDRKIMSSPGFVGGAWKPL